MMTYTTEIVELDASSTICRIDTETEEEFLERMAKADGMNFFVVSVTCIRNERATKFQSASPYFKADEPESRRSVFREAMKVITKSILEREEQLPPDETDYEAKRIVTV